MEQQRKHMPEWRKETRVGIIIALSAVLLFGGMYLISSAMRDDNNTTSSITNTTPTITVTTPSTGEVVDPVYDPLAENLIKPFIVDAQIGRYFYDMSDDEETRANAIVAVPGKTNTYTKSVGVDYVFTESFKIYASCSGKVISKSNDLVYGNVLIIEHPSGIRTIYASLSDIKVNKNDEIKQGDYLGVSGTSSYTNGFGESLHFEVLNSDNEYINPEKSYNLPLKTL